MSFLSQLRAIVGAVPRAQVRWEARRYLATASDCRSAQLATLHRLMQLNGDSRFAQEHRLAEIRTVDEFRERLPVSRYEDFREAVDAVKAGDHKAFLGSRNRLLMFSLSSGTTAESKYIPITDHFLSDYRRGWQIWGIQTLDHHPGCNSRTIVQICSSYDRSRTAGGTPCGSISGLVSAMQKRIVRSMYTVPAIVSQIDDPESRYYTLLRIAVAEAQVGMVTTANPSTLIHLARVAEERQDELLRDIADGTLSPQADVSPALRIALRPWTGRRNPRRARFLKSLADRLGRFFPRDYWAEMQVVAVWTGGSVTAYLPRLREYYGDIPVRDHGLSASEGRMTIPLSSETSSGVLDVHSHFFEFIPEAEYGKPDPLVLQSHELELGKRYYILLTTPSGFCRYDICDVVRCTGFFGTTPELEFLHKGAHIANLTGEKITEHQVVSVMRSVSEREGIPADQFLVCPIWGDPPKYGVLVESSPLVDHQVDRYSRQIDLELQRQNCEYREKRQTARLGEMKIHPLQRGAFLRLQQDRLARSGGSHEQYKHPCLVPDLSFWDGFASRHLTTSSPTKQNRSA